LLVEEEIDDPTAAGGQGSGEAAFSRTSGKPGPAKV
jgi:hypothetical protein